LIDGTNEYRISKKFQNNLHGEHTIGDLAVEYEGAALDPTQVLSIPGVIKGRILFKPPYIECSVKYGI
jgi:hypothetical protein